MAIPRQVSNIQAGDIVIWKGEEDLSGPLPDTMGMVIDTNPHVISFIGENGITERTFSGKNSFINARDIEVNGVENVYVIGEESKVFVLKQEKLRHE